MPPSPRSYWVNLRHIEDPAHGRGSIPEEPLVPLSFWIDLHPIEDYQGLVQEVAPEPASMFLDLHHLKYSSLLEVPLSPADLTLELHQVDN